MTKRTDEYNTTAAEAAALELHDANAERWDDPIWVRLHAILLEPWTGGNFGPYTPEQWLPMVYGPAGQSLRSEAELEEIRNKEPVQTNWPWRPKVGARVQALRRLLRTWESLLEHEYLNGGATEKEILLLLDLMTRPNGETDISWCMESIGVRHFTNMSTMLRKMEERGWIAKRMGLPLDQGGRPRDTVRKFIDLTGAGWVVAERLCHDIDILLAEFCARLGAYEPWERERRHDLTSWQPPAAPAVPVEEFVLPEVKRVVCICECDETGFPLWINPACPEHRKFTEGFSID